MGTHGAGGRADGGRLRRPRGQRRPPVAVAARLHPRHPPRVPRGGRRLPRSPTPSSPRASGSRSGGSTTRRASRTVAAARLAREACGRVRDGGPAALRGRLRGPDRACCRRATTRRSPRSRYPQLVELFREQAAALLEGGVDLLQIETMQDILETRAAVQGARLAFERGRPARAAAGRRWRST